MRTSKFTTITLLNAIVVRELIKNIREYAVS